jgi:hypothetical protein
MKILVNAVEWAMRLGKWKPLTEKRFGQKIMNLILTAWTFSYIDLKNVEGLISITGNMWTILNSVYNKLVKVK